MPTWEDLYKKAEEDYKAALGRIIFVTQLTCFFGRERRDILCNPPARMRVIQTPARILRNVMTDQWLDPVWRLEVVDYHPALNGATGFRTYGPSYRLNGEVMGISDVVFEDQPKPKEGP